MKVLIITVLSAVLAITSVVAFADTPLDVLGVEKSVNNAAKRAQETGDTVALAFAEQALRVITEWKKANESLIQTALEKLDSQTRQLFTDINNVSTRIENDEAVAFVDFQRTLAAAGGVLEKLPFSSKKPLVAFYWPTILIPSTERTVNVRVIGTGIANANPHVSGNGKAIEVKKYTDNDIGFSLERGQLNISEREPKTFSFKLNYEAERPVWYNPVSWWPSVKERTIELSMLPSVPGTVSLTQTVRKLNLETKEIGPFTVGGVGQDNIYRTGYPLIPQDIQDGWNVDMAAQAQAKFDDNGGDGDGGSSCTGWDPGRFTNTYVGFNIQHGHNGNSVRKTDAHQNCRIWVKLKRSVTTDEKLPPVSKNLSWLSDTDFDLEPNLVSYEMTMMLYNGRSFNIKTQQQIPYSLFELLQDKTNIKFRPRPQRDF
jgi:hypothetical protein